ncbi:MAG: hypothetical protein J6P65_03165 [Bacteroidales bacterium]|jgi:Chain length determinant protein|nr:hypothetical protein [Bacteroidales bacterium]
MAKNDRQFNSFSLVQFMWQKRKTLFLVCLVVAVVSLIASFLVTPKFKSTAIVYAPRTNSVAKILLNEESYNERLDMKAYADDEETEQMMEILNSREIKDILIDKFDLYNHYGLGEGVSYRQTKMYKYLKGNIEVKRTQYGAIAVSVIDKDPQVAADMANEILVLLDSVKNRIDHERTIASYNLLKRQLEIVDAEVQRIDDSVQVLMQNGVFDFKSQSERVMQQYATAVAQGNTAGMKRLEDELKKMATWGPRSLTLYEEQAYFREYQSVVKIKMMNAIVDMDTEIPVKFVIERAIPADKKTYPKKSLIVLLSTVSAFILAVLVLLTIDKIRETPVTAVQSEED